MLIAADQDSPVTIKVNSLIGNSLIAISQEASTYLILSEAENSRKKPEKCKLFPPLIFYLPPAILGRPQPPIVFPLSADHCLITVIEYNVIRAILFSMAQLAIPDYVPASCKHLLRIISLDLVSMENTPPISNLPLCSNQRLIHFGL